MEEITLCSQCKSDFEDAGVKLIQKEWQEHKGTCDFCNFRKGFTYIISEDTNGTKDNTSTKRKAKTVF